MSAESPRSVAIGDIDDSIASDLETMYSLLRLGLALEGEPQLRKALARSGELAVGLPSGNGWMVLGAHGVQFTQEYPSRLAQISLEALSTDDRAISFLRNPGASRRYDDRTKAILDEVARPDRLDVREAFKDLLDWAPLLAPIAYRMVARIAMLLDLMRPGIRDTLRWTSVDAVQSRLHYWRLLALLGRLTLLSTHGSQPWLADMANSFPWRNWTPTFTLLRERSLWHCAIAGRAAAAFGPGVLDAYSMMLDRVTHPAKALDCLVGLTSIGLRHGGARTHVASLLDQRRSRLSRRAVTDIELFLIGFDQALELLAVAEVGSRSGALRGKQTLSPSALILADPFDHGIDRRFPALEILPAALSARSWEFLPGTSIGARHRNSPADPDIVEMFRRAWVDGGETERSALPN